jgi:site-specific DNA-methyltransferase (adenine-specific)
MKTAWIRCAECQTITVDLVVTSPPYDKMRLYRGYQFDFEAIAKELYRVIKPGGVLVWVVNDETVNGSETATTARQKLFFRDVSGFNLHDTMIWEKTNPLPVKEQKRYNQAFEYMLVFSKGTPTTFNPILEKCKTAGQIYTTVKDTRNRSGATGLIIEPKRKNATKSRYNVWKMGHASKNYGHPAVFPDQLAEDHIKTWINPGDLVFDPMAGSGTTLVMAKKLGRSFIGSEISAEYCKIIEQRLSLPTEKAFSE